MLLKVIEFSIVLLLALQNGVSAYYQVTELTGLKPQMTIEIIGEIEVSLDGDADKEVFYIDLQEAGDDAGEGDVDLHVSVRYGRDKLVLNNWTNGGWGQEEKYDLTRRFTTTVQITARDNSFLININGNKYIFKYRMPKENLEKIKYLVIGGKIDPSSIDLEA